MKFSALLILLAFTSVFAHSQDLEQWRAYPSLRMVNSVTVDDDERIWAASDGGLLTHDTANNKTSFLTTLDGLSAQDVRVIIYDAQKNSIYMGYNNGKIDILRLDTQEAIISLTDIARSESYASRRINDLLVHQNRLYVATDFGIVVYDTDGLFVVDSYLQFGNLNRALAVYAISIREGVLYAATERGAAAGNLSQNLVVHSNWQSYDDTNGFVSAEVRAIDFWNGKIVASTAASNYVFDGNTWQVNPEFGPHVILDYATSGTGIYTAISASAVFTSNDGTNFEEKNLGSVPALSLSGETDRDGHIYFGTLNNGVGVLNPVSQQVTYITPEGPNLNMFSDLVALDGTLISGSTQKGSANMTLENAKGYYIYENGEWQSLNKLSSPVLWGFDFRNAFTAAASEQYYYFGSWGQGVARHNRETGEITVFNEANSILRGWVDDDPNYPVISGLGADSNGDMWLVSRYGSRPLYYQKAGEDDWIDFPRHSAAGANGYFRMFVDSRDRKWITLQNTSAAGTGLLVLDTGDVDDPNDDQGVRLTSGENSGNLPDDQVKVIVEDRNGEIWVGTQRGIARFIFPEFILDGGPAERRAQWLISEDTSSTSRFLLRDANVTTIAVNGANEKWIGTENQGIFVVNAEGSRIVKRFTAENSPLYSNNILSIAINNHSGEVFVATDMGLMSYHDIPQQARAKMENLKVFPNPFNYSKHSQIVIEALSEITVVKILGVDGTVVREIESRGGRISWNGLDANNRQLGSGVYFVVAYEEDGKERGIGKVVIIR